MRSQDAVPPSPRPAPAPSHHCACVCTVCPLHSDVKLRARVRSSPAVFVLPADLLPPLIAFVGPVRRDQVADIQEAIAKRV
jgi:hypothetical protein